MISGVASNGNLLVARLDPDGELDTTFGPNGQGYDDSLAYSPEYVQHSVLIQSSGQIVVVGWNWRTTPRTTSSGIALTVYRTRISKEKNHVVERTATTLARSAANKPEPSAAGATAQRATTSVEALEHRMLLSVSPTALAYFNGSNAGMFGGLLEEGGNLIGATTGGGQYGYGSIFEVAAAGGPVTTLASFNGPNGTGPNGTAAAAWPPTARPPMATSSRTARATSSAPPLPAASTGTARFSRWL